MVHRNPVHVRFFVLSCFVLLSILAHAQSDSVTVNISITNQITGKPIDATLNWYLPETVKQVEWGKYTIGLDGDKEELLTITKPGYFDSEVKIDYETVKQNPLQEIQLQPGIPQLHISVLDAVTNQPLTSAIDLFTLDEATEIFSEEVSVAPYIIDLEYDQAHVLQVRAPGYFSFKDTIDYKRVFDGRVRKKEIRLVPLKLGSKISLNNIHFEPNQAELTDFAKLMLVELSHVLSQKTKMVLEISAYTDDVGTDEYNLELSRKRALSVKNYLVEKGARPEQLPTKGFGEGSPVVPNTNDANRALNRRVEFRIVNLNE